MTIRGLKWLSRQVTLGDVAAVSLSPLVIQSDDRGPLVFTSRMDWPLRRPTRGTRSGTREAWFRYCLRRQVAEPNLLAHRGDAKRFIRVLNHSMWRLNGADVQLGLVEEKCKDIGDLSNNDVAARILARKPQEAGIAGVVRCGMGYWVWTCGVR